MPIWLNNVQCSSGDRYLSQCNHNGWGINNCQHYKDVGVECSQTAGLL